MGEPFAAAHDLRGDRALLRPPPQPITPMRMFVCTYGATIAGLRPMSHRAMAALLVPRGPVLAVNCNFSHACQPGFERLLKAPPAQRAAGGRRREGDGTCFNSAVEATVVLDCSPGECLRLLADPRRQPKLYFIKCFPSTGEIQVPGVVRPDLADGSRAVEAWVALLEAAGLAAGPAGITIAQQGPIMINYKFQLCRSSPRILLDLRRLAALLADPAAAPGPPLPLRGVDPPDESPRVAARYVTDQARRKTVLANFFNMGKINILGARAPGEAQTVYDYIARLLRAHWGELAALTPLSDEEEACRCVVPEPEEIAARILGTLRRSFYGNLRPSSTLVDEIVDLPAAPLPSLDAHIRTRRSPPDGSPGCTEPP